MLGPSRTHAWLSGMKCSGEAFVVMKQEADVENFFSSWDQPRGLQRTGSFFSFHDGSPVPNSSPQSWKKTRREREFRGHELDIREVTSEPTSIIWEHMGTTHLQLTMRICIALIGFLLAIGLFYGVLYLAIHQGRGGLGRSVEFVSFASKVSSFNKLGGPLRSESWETSFTFSEPWLPS